MLVEFKAEENDKPYRPTRLNETGRGKFVEMMERAIQTGDIQSLEAEVSAGCLKSTELRTVNGKTYWAKVPSNAAHILAHTEFSTWYTKGLARRLIEEGDEKCEVYRAEAAARPRCRCSRLEGNIVSVRDVYNGHRKYHYAVPQEAISIPGGPLCHHTIRRVKRRTEV